MNKGPSKIGILLASNKKHFFVIREFQQENAPYFQEDLKLD
ncbi:hypothetical protein EV14_1485 [Prochlorococcus sp. MIT 0703]|nr:hypothetical protein EV12_0335 [Prochlorococcus sp. MIT 0701]KGG34138.1 hypothetical protein EV14_1485 [Prochlorococcus sp. MIT 0703]